MTVEPRPDRPDATLHDLRQAARRQARQLPGGLMVLGGVMAALLLVAVFVLLDYRFNQDPHRIVKILLGATLIGGIAMRPKVGLFLIPILTPFLSWLPKIPVPGVNPLNVLLFSVFFAFALPRALRREPLFRHGRLTRVIIAIIALAALSIVRGAAFPTGYGFDASDAAQGLFRCSMTFMIYFITLAMARGDRDRKLLSWAVVLGLIAEAVVTILYGRNGKGHRALGSFGQSNELGAFLAMFAVLSASMILGVRNLLGKLLLMGGVVVATIGVLLSVSRGAMVALAAGLLFVAARSSRTLLLLFLAALVTSPLWAPDYVKERVSGVQVEESGDELEFSGGTQSRIDTWKAILTLIENHPLDGVGFTGLGNVLPEAGQSLGLEVRDTAHNTYLRFLAEMGLFGLLLFLTILWQSWKLANDGARAARSRFDRQLAIALGGATVAMALSCAFGDRFFSILVTGNFWLLCALVNDLVLEQSPARPGLPSVAPAGAALAGRSS